MVVAHDLVQRRLLRSPTRVRWLAGTTDGFNPQALTGGRDQFAHQDLVFCSSFNPQPLTGGRDAVAFAKFEGERAF
jgi:hypothetical protein